MQLVTNNPQVLSLHSGARWVSGGPREVLTESRRLVHQGYPLLTHPLMGDVHLLANPFRTVILADRREEVHLPSLRWIEESMGKIYSLSPKSNGAEGLEDYQALDFELVQTALGGISMGECRGERGASPEVVNRPGRKESSDDRSEHG